MIGTLIGAASAAITWILAYFATQTAVSQLECRLSHQLLASQHETRASALQAAIDTRQSLLKFQANQKMIKPLMDEVRDLTAKADDDYFHQPFELQFEAEFATAEWKLREGTEHYSATSHRRTLARRDRSFTAATQFERSFVVELRSYWPRGPKSL